MFCHNLTSPVYIAMTSLAYNLEVSSLYHCVRSQYTSIIYGRGNARTQRKQTTTLSWLWNAERGIQKTFLPVPQRHLLVVNGEIQKRFVCGWIPVRGSFLRLDQTEKKNQRDA